jgi:hypothetical protein
MEKRFCHYCKQEKSVDLFVSNRKCWDCAQWRTCYTCGQRKHIKEFPQETSKGCSECRRSGLAKQKKAEREAKRYRENTKDILARNEAWRKANISRWESKQREYRNRKRMEQRNQVLVHYGGKCACCGESEPLFLTIDHIDGNGAQHRRMIGKTDMWKWLCQQNFPGGYRLLCFNCNAGRYRNGGRCPHEDSKLNELAE